MTAPGPSALRAPTVTCRSEYSEEKERVALVSFVDVLDKLVTSPRQQLIALCAVQAWVHLSQPPPGATISALA